VSRMVDEFTRYTESTPTTDNVDDIIDWWRLRQEEFPVLSRMAFDILSIPGTSAEIERVFSAAGRLLTDDRNKLVKDTI
jgi:hypothetical protein